MCGASEDFRDACRHSDEVLGQTQGSGDGKDVGIDRVTGQGGVLSVVCPVPFHLFISFNGLCRVHHKHETSILM